MPIILPRPSDKQDEKRPHLVCPSCGGSATRSQARADGYERTADCLCAEGHAFIVKWLVAA